MKYQTGSFLKGFGITMGLFLFVIGSVNYLVDPYWYREKRINNFNRLPISDIENHIPILSVYRLHAKGKNVKFSIIGTSHILFGISECNYPFLEKIAAPAISIEESSRLMQKILAEATVSKTIFIEVCGINNLPNLRDDNFFNRIFSLRTAIYSLRTIKTNLVNHQQATPLPCIPYFGRTNPAARHPAPAPLRLFTAEELTTIKESYQIDHQPKNTLQHQVIFFVAPLPFETTQKEIYKINIPRLSIQMQKTISSMQSNAYGVRFKFINLLDTEIGKEYQFRKNNFNDGWYDGNHFKPIIGDQVVRYLIDHSR